VSDASLSRPTNRLIHEKSPYLLQHAHNPVDWYPWGDEAFVRAREQDRPIFLSVGYSTCHWCHVMERESFEDSDIAALMNAHFINIKVDREERPDVDRVYMGFVQASTGQGGWPMSVWLTPELKPFVGGTYFPPKERYGHPGFAQLLMHIHHLWENDRDKVEASASWVLGKLSEAAGGSTAEAVDPSVLAQAYEHFGTTYDREFAGFGDAPKFPRPAVFNFLLRYHVRTQAEGAREMTLATLRQMARGGIYDQLGGGFHRYSVDREWHVPHFEKMLYDQAQLVRSYLDGFQLAGDLALADQARGVLDYVLRDLTDPETGAFYSAEDADSALAGEQRKREGAFYVWTREQIGEVLGDDAEAFALHLGLTAQGNADDPHGELTGTNVLHVMRAVSETAAQTGKRIDEIEALLARCSQRLLEVRAQRPRPPLDDKAICAWNGMMISALARAHSVLDDTTYLDAAARAAHFILQTLYDEEQQLLYRRYRQGERALEGYAEDYTQLVEGLLDLYEASGELRWLQRAEDLTQRQIALFYDHDQGGFFTTSGSDASVLIRLKEDHDGAEPAASSVASSNLLRLAAMLDRPEWVQLAAQTIRCFGQTLRRAPFILPQLLVALDTLHNSPAQVVIVGERTERGMWQLLRAVNQPYAPNKVVLLADSAFIEAYGKRLPHIAVMQRIDGQPTAYVCRNEACRQPTTDPAQLVAQLL